MSGQRMPPVLRSLLDDHVADAIRSICYLKAGSGLGLPRDLSAPNPPFTQFPADRMRTVNR